MTFTTFKTAFASIMVVREYIYVCAYIHASMCMYACARMYVCMCVCGRGRLPGAYYGFDERTGAATASSSPGDQGDRKEHVVLIKVPGLRVFAVVSQRRADGWGSSASLYNHYNHQQHHHHQQQQQQVYQQQQQQQPHHHQSSSSVAVATPEEELAAVAECTLQHALLAATRQQVPPSTPPPTTGGPRGVSVAPLPSLPAAPLAPATPSIIATAPLAQAGGSSSSTGAAQQQQLLLLLRRLRSADTSSGTTRVMTGSCASRRPRTGCVAARGSRNTTDCRKHPPSNRGRPCRRSRWGGRGRAAPCWWRSPGGPVRR
eukprot:GHVU01108193.1.p1 GENE.GHVU01108193.1~~GHVU01108193.1.p1  ORF type:complete len:316 (+),score=51.72 GHVU01108193.1:230-1177(+)